jgi:zinc protease
MNGRSLRSVWLLVVALAMAVACARPAAQQTTPSAAAEATPGAPEEAEPEREPLGDTAVVALPSESPVVTLRVLFAAGSADDPKGLEGLTRITAQLMVEGGAGALSHRELVERLYPMAAELRSRTGRDQTVLVARVHRDHLDDFLPIFEDVLSKPRLPRGDLERLRARALAALTLELRGNDDEALGKETLQAMIYEGHPYAHPALGTEAGLKAIGLADVERHRQTVLCGGRAAVGVAGAFPEGLPERLRRHVDGLRSERCQGRARLPDPLEGDGPEGPRMWLVDKPEAGSVAISMGLPIEVTRDHPDYPALTLAAAYFGQHRQFVGRLMRKMRSQRGLNYGNYAYAEHFVQDGWTRFPAPNVARRQQYFSVWIRPVRVEQAHFALRMAVRELRQFVADGLTDDDVVRVRRFAEPYYAQYLQTESRRLGFALDDWFHGIDLPWLETLRTGWRDLTADQVNAALRRHLDLDRLQIAAVHPQAPAFADEVAKGTPSPIEYRAQVPEEVRAEDEAIQAYPVSIPRARIRVVPVGQLFE